MPSSERADRAGRALDGLREHEALRVDPPAGGPPPGAPAIERFDILEVLGEGAAAVVYRARDRRLGREVALKVLRDSLGASPGVRDRFHREAAVAASLSHPNLVAVHDAGDSAGRLYLVMERIDGSTLNELLARKGTDRSVLLRLLLNVARGVAAAHGKGIIHRDLKPSNILVTAAGEPKVGDFGLAHIEGADAGLTRTGAVLGTPLYMAPEQVRGATREISARTDVYALGVILYEMITGRPPHSGDSVSEIFGRIVADEPLPPRRLDPAVPRDLETVTLKALEKEPERRYPSAAEFADDLERQIAGEPIAAKAVSTLNRAWRRAVRHRWQLLPATAALLIAAGSSAIVLRNASIRKRNEAEMAEALKLLEVARPALDKATQAYYHEDVDMGEARRQAEQARKLIGETVGRHPRLALGHYLLGRAWDLDGGERQAEECWRAAIAIDPSFGPARFQLGRLLAIRSAVRVMLRDDPAVATRLAEEAAREIGAAAAAGSGFDDELQGELARAFLAFARNDGDAAIRACRAGGKRFGRSEGAEQFHWLAGVVIRGEGRTEERIGELDQAISIRPRYSLAYFTRAVVLRDSDPTRALADFAAALAIQPNFRQAYLDRGFLRKQLDDVDGAIADFSETIRLDPDLPHGWSQRGDMRRRKGDLDGAIADYREALRRGPPDPAKLHYNLASTLELRRDPEGALSEYNEAIRVNPGLAEAWNARGNIRMEKGDQAGAMGDYDEAIRLRPASPSLIYYNRGRLWYLKGNAARALEDFSESLRHDPANVEAWVNRAIILGHEGRHDEAIRDYSEAIRLRPAGAKAWHGRGKGRLAMDAPGPALGDFSEALRLEPGNPEVLVDRGQAFQLLGRAAEAVADYEKALEAAPKDWPSRRRIEDRVRVLRREY